MAIPATQIRRGMVIVFEGQPCKVLEFRHHTPGNLRAMVQTKLRNIRTGSSFEHRFRSADTVDRAALEQHEMEYLYSDGSHHHFMNTENYEQIALNEDDLGDAAQWLTPGLKLQAEFYEGAPIGIDHAQYGHGPGRSSHPAGTQRRARRPRSNQRVAPGRAISGPRRCQLSRCRS